MQATELRVLVTLILAHDTDEDRAEALAIALADPEDALVSLRLLAAELREREWQRDPLLEAEESSE